MRAPIQYFQYVAILAPLRDELFRARMYYDYEKKIKTQAIISITARAMAIMDLSLE